MLDRALLVDRNYMALSVVSWKRAVRLIINGKVEEIETDSKIKIDRNYEISSVIRLLNDIPYRACVEVSKFSRKNVLIRDKYSCRYCGKSVGKNGTIDHIIPKSLGGKTDYLNCVTCCKFCNGKKSNMTLEQSGMKLLTIPRKPRMSVFSRNNISVIPSDWKDYII